MVTSQKHELKLTGINYKKNKSPPIMKSHLIQKLNNFGSIMGLGELKGELTTLKKIMIESYLENRLNEKRYDEPGRLNKHEYQVLSQNGEDGIIYEICKRIGTPDKYFVEFGVGNGTENNTAYLLMQNWTGSWIEGSSKHCIEMKLAYADIINSNQLFIKESFITKDNIINLFEELKIPQNLTLLSIDIDGNDYWVWKTLSNYKPRILVIEYNASVGPHINWVMPYDEKHVWNGQTIGHYFGASLKALELLGRELGYSLVGCNLTGANAFFVRNDLITPGLFAEPFTAENHYEKPMYFLEKQLGHKRNYKLINSFR